MSKLGKEGHKRRFWKIFKSQKDEIVNSSLPQMLKERKKREMENLEPVGAENDF